MKKFFFFATALFAAISFSACSVVVIIVGAGSSAINYVSEVVCQYSAGDMRGDIRTHKFEYNDRNRLTKVTEKRNGDEERVLFPNQDRDWVFNEKGYLIYDRSYSYNGTYKYDEEDHLIDGGYWSYIWENGDCIRMQNKFDEKDYSINTYSNRIVNLNFEIWQLFDLTDFWYYAFTGRKSKHLLQKSDENEGDYISLYEYEFDEKGRPVTVYRTTTHDYGDKNRETVTIKYK